MGSIYGKNSSRPVFESTLLFSCKAVSEVPISEEAPESSSPPCFSPCKASIGPFFTSSALARDISVQDELGVFNLQPPILIIKIYIFAPQPSIITSNFG
ncbi:hypothetical protein RCL_jg22799.t1 [Rhizophagus clarus]|uniref:Uncharacterized protein n=1 Tax=Rhizophagus clarus TaxID=94130 RepID=A0A8H3LFE6_9GLOM|nr:hypothetical protein RCL_jg22799.t1 [Rhizophagus clarus]